MVRVHPCGGYQYTRILPIQFDSRLAVTQVRAGDNHLSDTGVLRTLYHLAQILFKRTPGEVNADINILRHMRYHISWYCPLHNNDVFRCMTTPSICIICSSKSRIDQARALADETGLPLLEQADSDYDLQLGFDNDRIKLVDTALATEIDVDFVKGALAHRQQFGGGRGQAIARAIGLKHGNTPSVLDATAGLARDAFVLAALGCKMTLVEQSPILFTLVEDGIRRGLENPDSAGALGNFMNLVKGDTVLFMEHMDWETRPDVIYIDPMYPERKKSARVKKDMQILQKLIGKTQNAEQLLTTALSVAGKRVVVKRPIHADALTGLKPDTSISSKKTRYDIYLCREPDRKSAV